MQKLAVLRNDSAGFTASGDDAAFRPDFEKPKDEGKNNKYEVTVVAKVTDGRDDDSLAVGPAGKKDVIVTVTP